MEVRRVEGSKLIDNIVYNIYQNEGNVNVGVCLVISENNRNNGNKIKLRKLIGNDELSLNKSEIYGKKPVNLTCADLTGADLTGADLTDANLTCANLTSADLTGADLTDANLTCANLTSADLTGAVLTDANLNGADLTGVNLTDATISFSNLTLSNLTNANLTRVNLYLTDLTDSNLTGAVLTNSELVDATLTYAIISRNSLSPYQIENIFGQPKYIEELSQEQLSQEQLRQEQRRQEQRRQEQRRQEQRRQEQRRQEQRRQELLRQQRSQREEQRQVENNGQNRIPNVRQVLSFNNNNIPPPNQQPQQVEKRITIREKLLNPSHSKNSCPKFNELYEFIMRQNLSGRFFFIYEGSNHKVIDYGGPKRDVFDKILPAYTKKFFKEIKDNEDYVILKEDVDMNILIPETERLILLASASETKIFLKIDPTLLSLFVESLQSFIKYFNNNKRKRFSKLYREFNQYIEHRNNNSELLKYNTNKRELMKNLKNQELKNEKLKKTLEQEIRFRRFAITRGFTNMQQFINMFNFIKVFYNISSPEDSFITCELKFDIETILKTIKLFKKIYVNPVDYYLEPIPLEQYVRLSKNNKSVLILNRADDIIINYPYLIPFLNFIFGPESSDADRELFVVYVSGSSSYTGELKICVSSLTRVKAERPFHATTCEKYLELFIDRDQNRHHITVDAIRSQLLADTGFGLE
jgi:uncharacterized protein YjbI with pentapeptide repeats